MSIDDLIRYISLGKVPITVYCTPLYSGLYSLIRITKNNKVFFDIEDDKCEEGGFRATLQYDNIDSMIKSIQMYTGLNLEKWEIIHEKPQIAFSESIDLSQFKIDLFNHIIKFPAGAVSMNIGDQYWNALYNQEISPNASVDEILSFFKRKNNENCSK